MIGGRLRGRVRLVLLGALCGGLVAGGASAGTIVQPDPSGHVKAKGATAAERKALDIVSVTATGIEPVGVVVTATFAGNVEQLLGRRHLESALVALILQPKDATGSKPADVATTGAGALGRTLSKTRSKDVDVFRRGRRITFFVGGTGFQNVGRIEVKAFAASPAGGRSLEGASSRSVTPEQWERIEDSIAADEAILPAPDAGTSCDELRAMELLLGGMLDFSEHRRHLLLDAKKQLERTLGGVQQAQREKRFGAAAGELNAMLAILGSGVDSAALFAPLPSDFLQTAATTLVDGPTDSEREQALRGAIRSLKLDVRLADALLARNDALVARITPLRKQVEASIAKACAPGGTTSPPPAPTLQPIHAFFDQSTFSTTYTESASGGNLTYAWSVSIPTDPGCAAGFKAGSPQPNQATWYHADRGEGGPCSHADYDASGAGHPGTVTVTVSDGYWSCAATYRGTQGGDGSPAGDGPAPEPCVKK